MECPGEGDARGLGLLGEGETARPPRSAEDEDRRLSCPVSALLEEELDLLGDGVFLLGVWKGLDGRMSFRTTEKQNREKDELMHKSISVL